MIPLIAAALYGMAGHQNNERRKRDDARQNMLDTRDSETHNAKMAQESDRAAEVQREKDFRDANSAALSAGQLDQGQQVTDSAGSNAFTKDPQAAAMLGDMAESKNGGASVVNAARVSTGRQGATMAGTVAGNQIMSDPIQAQAFAKTQTMGDYAKMKARQEVADQFGKMEVSDAIRGKLATLEGEGAFKALAMAKAGDFAGAAAHYGATGNDRLPDGATFDSVETTDPITKQPRQTIRMLGKDGKPLIADMDQAFRAYLTPVQQETLNHQDRKDIKESGKTQAEIEHLGAQSEKERAYANYLNGGGAAGAKAANGGDKPFKMDEDDKLRMKEAGRSVSDAEALVAKAMTGMMQGDDPTKLPAVAYAQKLLQQAKKNQLKTHVDIGQITPDKMVTDIMGAAKNQADVMRSLNELSGSVGVEFADQVANALGGNDAWLQMTRPAQAASPTQSTAKSPTAPPKPVVTMASTVQSTTPAVAPAAPAPRQSGTGSVFDFLKGVGDDYSSPAGKAALQKRVSQAKTGGDPLTRVELLRAKQAGLIG